MIMRHTLPFFKDGRDHKFTVKSAYAEYVRDLLFTCIHGVGWRTEQRCIDSGKPANTVRKYYIKKNPEIEDDEVVFIQMLICLSLTFDNIDHAVS